MHLTSCSTKNIIAFSDASWTKFVHSSLQWVNLQTTESQIAERAVKKYNLVDSHIPDVPANLGYHRECYMQYANIRSIERARKRRENTVQEAEGLYQIKAALNFVTARKTL